MRGGFIRNRPRRRLPPGVIDLRKMLALLFISSVLLTACGAPAAVPTATQGWLGGIMTLIAVVVAGVVVWAGTALAKKFGFELKAEQMDTLKKVVKDGIYYAEEWAAKRFKIDGIAASGSEKLNNAVGFVLGKIPGADTAEVKDAIHAVLGSIQGLGASKTVGTPSTPTS